MNKAEELIACLEGEIAKRDETIARLEPQLNRAIQDNYDLRAELSALKAQEPVSNSESGLEEWSAGKFGVGGAFLSELCGNTDWALARLVWSAALAYAAPVSEPKAQGVVMPERETERFNAAYGAAVESGWESVKCMARQIWDAARLNAAPVQHGTKAEISMAGCRCVRYGEGNPHWPCPLHSAPVQQVSVPDGWKLVPVEPTPEMISAGNDAAHAGGCDLYQLTREVMNAYPAMLAAAPAAPAADACKACNGTGRRPIGGRGKIFGLTNRCFECHPVTVAEFYGVGDDQ